MALLGDNTGAFLTSETQIPHKYTVIPSDQQELLAQPDAWNTKGIPNVPPKVLQDVKEAYLRRLRAAAGSAQATPVSRHPGRLNGSSRVEDDMKDGQGHEHSDDDNGEPIPWSSSPAQHKQAPVPRDELPTPRPINLRVRSPPPLHSDIPLPSSSPPRRNNLRVPSSPPLPTRRPSPHKVSQTPPQNAARPAALVNPKARVRVVQREPPSSLASEPDLEYQPPRAITDVVSPVDRVLRSTQPPPPVQLLRSMQPPAPTPPSAQEPVTVPCTWKEPSNPGEGQQTAEEPAKKRRRLMKHPPFESSQAVDSNSAAAPSGEEGYDSSQVGQVVALNRSYSSSGRLPPNGPASQAPFVAFCTAYPSYTLYKGTLRDFVSAAISIQHLQKTRSLPDFLYDDYIRVWAHQYISYMRNCVEERRKPLTGIQWYNEHVPEPEYNKRIFTRGNIADITEHHSDVADLVRNMSREHRDEQSDNDASSLPAAASPTTILSPRTTVLSPTPQVGSEGLHLGGSRPKDDISSLPAATSPLVASSGPPRSGRGVLPGGGSAPAQSAQSVVTPRANMHAMLRPDQIEKIEPLRSVSGYVVTMSPSRASASKRDHKQRAVAPPAPPEIKDEEDESSGAQLPPMTPDIGPSDRVSAAHAASSDRNPAPTSTNRSPAYAFGQRGPARILTEQATTRKADTGRMMQASESITQDYGDEEPERQSNGRSMRPPESRPPAFNEPLATAVPSPSPWGSNAPAPQPKKPSRPRPRSPTPSFGDVLTQPPSTALSFIPDFTRSVESIPDTAIKPKDAPRFNHRAHGPPAFSSASKPPASSAVSASRNVKGKKLTKADRFRMFVEKRQAQSSAPKSTIED
ncbi:hypothetical protein CONLIGDRAFT_717724 [Coniochaeta ligniaria NRRL 30616]|uniref:Uncharacterized protein n=1 Tax=Coniochaeta ligniaria NRRL 30616 TaxID=1408157 RepID=A0A1J7IEG4_9PEZI|nr:hypothetical protein CONLIGDRAFT_717724 [Coniochaeta ligniaria NRRL 30616]